jgi:hypothetical protein
MKDIRDLAIALERKKACFDAIGMQNTYGLTVEEVESRFADYEVARAEVQKAEADLRKAQNDYAEG